MLNLSCHGSKLVMHLNNLLGLKGTYILIISCSKDSTIIIGKHRKVRICKEGTYIYVGSAFGPGGLYRRILRHLKYRDKKKFWHIDYLLNNQTGCSITHIIVIPKIKIEHQLASELYNHVGRGVIGFGCSECKCKTHLIVYEKKPHIVIKELLNYPLIKNKSFEVRINR